MPLMTAVIELPEVLDPTHGGNTRINKLHNAACKDAMEKVLLHHKKVRIPWHFMIGKQKRYQYKTRSRAYYAMKRRRGFDPADMVKTGISKMMMTGVISPRIKIGGSGMGTMTGTMTLLWKRGMRQGKKSNMGVTIKQMTEEMERWTAEEEQEAAEQFVMFYLDYIDKNIRPRTRIKMASRLASMGIVP